MKTGTSTVDQTITMRAATDNPAELTLNPERAKVKDVLSHAWGGFKTHFGLWFGIAAAITAVSLLLFAITLAPGVPDAAGVISYILVIAVGVYGNLVILQHATRLLDYPMNATPNSESVLGLRNPGKLIGGVIVGLLITAIVVAIPFIIVTLTTGATPDAHELERALTNLGIAAVVAMFLSIVVTVFLFFMFNAIIDSAAGPFEAIKRSFTALKHNWPGVLVTLLIITGGGIILVLLTALITGLMTWATNPVIAGGVGFLLEVLGGILLYVFTSNASAYMYRHLIGRPRFSEPFGGGAEVQRRVD